MMSPAVVLVALGVVCLGLSAWLIYLQLPREDRAPPGWMRTQSGEVAGSLGGFILLVAGISMIIKGVL